MDIFDFISQDEIDALPEDNPRAAFSEFTRIAQRRLTDAIRDVDSQDEGNWRFIMDARHGFMNVVIAAAKNFGVEPFASLEVPRVENFDERTHRQFRADLDHYLTQLVLDNGTRAKRASVSIPQETKAVIRTYVFHLREVIEKADVSESKKHALLQRLCDFEAELDKKRLNLMALSLLAITVLSAPGGISATGEVSARLLNNIMRAVGEAKAAEDETRALAPATEPLVITGPRKDDLVGSSASKNRSKTRESFNADLDDEIPF